MDYYDYDPETGEVVTEAVRLRIKEGFTQLINRLQSPLDEARERSDQQRIEEAKAINEKLGLREAFFIPEGCTFPVSPSLVKILGSRRDTVKQ